MDIAELKRQLAALKPSKRGRKAKAVEDIEAAIEDLEAPEEESAEQVPPPVEAVPEPSELPGVDAPPDAVYESPEAAHEPLSEPVEEDRSAFNCPDCAGEGLKVTPAWPQGTICDRCQGTGKI